MIDRAAGEVDEPGIVARLLEQLELANTSVLQRFTSLDAFMDLEYEFEPNFGIMRITKVLLLAALGRLPEADTLLAADIDYRDKHAAAYAPLYAKLRPGSKAWKRRQDDLASTSAFMGHLRQLHGLIARRDRVGLAALLHNWEAQGAVARKFEPYWAPTPFPLELGVGG